MYVEKLNIGKLRHRVSLDNPGAPVEEDDGGFSSQPTRLASRIPAAVETATAARMERVFAGTVTAMASHLVTLRYVPGVTTKTTVVFHDQGGTDRPMNVTDISDPEERHRVLVLACAEIVA